MSLSRRTVVGMTTALATAALVDVRTRADSFLVSQPVRMKLSDFVRNQRMVDALRRGVQVMRDRPGSDHRSWFWQGAVHAYNQAIHDAALSRDPNVAHVDAGRYWNKCPHFGEPTAEFLVWHRAYLFYFERILRDAAGEPELALPYWDYEHVDSRVFPSIFAPEYLSSVEPRPTNSLFHPEREAALVTNRVEISRVVGESAATRAASQFFSSRGVRGFAGSPASVPPEELIVGLIEQRPHNDIHVAVGGRIGSTAGAMAEVKTAAFDPLFWVHHANIDRMWAEWGSTPGKQWGPLPPGEWFEETPWIFKDVDGSDQIHSRRYYLDRRNLSVAYDSDRPGQAQLELPETFPLTEIVQQTSSITIFSTPGVTVSRSMPASIPLTANELVNGSLELTDWLSNDHLIVSLRDISVDEVPASGFAVHLTPAGHQDISEDSPYYLGNIAFFGLGHMHDHNSNHAAHEGGPRVGHQAFDASGSFDAIRAGNATLRVVPYELYSQRNGVDLISRDPQVRIGTVELRLIRAG